MARLVLRRGVRMGVGVARLVSGLLGVTSGNLLLGALGTAAMFSSSFMLSGSLKTQADREDLIQLLRTSRNFRLLFIAMCLVVAALCVLRIKTIMLG